MEGWNRIPEGYSATFDLAAAPRWLRAWFHSPLIDRFAYRLLVALGYGWLDVIHGAERDRDAAVARGWRILGDDEPGPVSVRLAATSGSTLRWRRRRYAVAAQRRRLLRPLGALRIGGMRGGRPIDGLNFIARCTRGAALVVLAGLGLRVRGGARVVCVLAGAAIAEAASVYSRSGRAVPFAGGHRRRHGTKGTRRA